MGQPISKNYTAAHMATIGTFETVHRCLLYGPLSGVQRLPTVTAATSMKASLIVWDLETVPDINPIPISSTRPRA